MPHIEVIGIYPVQEQESVHLIEIHVRGACGVFDIGDITQEVFGQPRSNWQVPCMEQILSASGGNVLANEFEMTESPDLWQGDMRLIFFFHFLDFQRPLRTPFEEVSLPTVSELPERLSMIQYEQP